jgi:hypothetical protein
MRHTEALLLPVRLLPTVNLELVMIVKKEFVWKTPRRLFVMKTVGLGMVEQLMKSPNVN